MNILSKNKIWLIPAVLIGIVLLLLVSAGSNKHSIRKAVSEELDQLENLDEDNTEDYLRASDLFPSDESLTPDPQITKLFSTYFKNFSYKTGKILTEGDTATVPVTIQNIDAHELARDYTMAALEKKIACEANPSQVEFSLKDSYLLLADTLENNHYKKVKTSFNIYLENRNGEWKMIHDDSLDNHLTGNFLTYMADSNLLTPEEVVTIHFNTIKDFDSEQLNIYLALNSLFSNEDTYGNSIAYALADQIRKFFDYKIIKTDSSDRTATVQVEITSTDFKNIMKDYQERLSNWVGTSSSMSGGAQGRRDKELEFLLKSIEENDCSSTNIVEIELLNDGTNWKMQMTNAVIQSIIGDVDTSLSEFSKKRR